MTRPALAVILALGLSACSGGEDPAGDAPAADAATAASVEAASPGMDAAAAARPASSPDGRVATLAAADLPTVLVYKTATCGCCNGWVEHMEEAGFTVDARDVRDLMSVKRDAGVPVDHSSCHTALVDGYVVEGHVPADVVKRLLAERPELAGIAVPGMPIGSPGMEGPNPQPYRVLGFDGRGGSVIYAEVDPR